MPINIPAEMYPMTPKTEKCPKCDSDDKNVLGKECQFRSSDPIHFKRAHEWHSTPPLPEQEGPQFVANDTIEISMLREKVSGLQDELKRMREALVAIKAYAEERNYLIPMGRIVEACEDTLAASQKGRG